VPVHAVKLQLVDDGRLLHLVGDALLGLPFDKAIAAEFARQNDQRSIEKLARFEIEHELRRL